jgi:AAA+ superfamily predicted ATPase
MEKFESNVVVETEGLTKVDIPRSIEYTFHVRKIREYIKNTFGTDVKLYTTFYECLDVISDQIKNGELKRVAIISDVISIPLDISHEEINKGIDLVVYSLEGAQEGSHGADVNFSNTLMYHEKFNVFIATFVYIIGNGRMEEYTLFFGENAANVKSYILHSMQALREKKLRHIRFIMDTRSGMERRNEIVDTAIRDERIYLDDDLKEQIFMFVNQFFDHEGKDFYQKYNIPYRRGILLYGRPGNGKTTLIRSLIKSIAGKVPIYYWQVTEYTTSESIYLIFSEIKQSALSSLLIIEDIDSMPQSCRSTFLNMLDGISVNEGVFIIGTTNYPDKIDPGLMNRAGRFDRSYEIKQPSAEIRRQYLIDRNILDIITEEQLEEIISRTKGMPMATLNEIFISCALYKYQTGSVDISKVMKEIEKVDASQKKGDFMHHINRAAPIGFSISPADYED